MDWYNLLEKGKKIIIGDDPKIKQGYDTGEFWMENGIIYSYCPAIGYCERKEMTRDRLNAHVDEMVEEKFQIIIQEAK